MSFRHAGLVGLGALVALTFAPSAVAATFVAKHRDWVVYTEERADEGKVCYARTDAVDMAPSQHEHGDVWFAVTTWEDDGPEQQPSLQVGYRVRDRAAGRASVGSSRFKLFGDQQDAFVDADADERLLITAMRRGSSMRAEITSDDGVRTAYEFSLMGVTAALNAIDAACR